ncbi:MAG: N-acetylmuramoyl-L-alanine amidase [Bacteroidetes bacterium]|nr:N-acetylmuramoyl-L-alanine amidase [Bacteroidota bacterium]
MKIKNSKWIFVLIISMLLNVNAISKSPSKNGKVNLVVIDAGHGGHDSGALGSNSKEKDVALAVALKLGKLIESSFSNVKVIYTRKTDEFIELYRRAQIANENHADLFISIHCNSSPSKEPWGTESWVMGLNKSQKNLEVAKKENAAILLEDNYSASYDGFNPNSPEANIIFSLFQNAYLDQSLDLAAKIQKQFKGNFKTIDRGVKQAGFLVLYKTTMPAILIETGFISNLHDEEMLTSENGRNEITHAIFKAFKEYKYKIEGFNNQNEIVSVKTEDVKVNTAKPFEKTDTVKIANTSKKEISFRVQFATSPTEKSTSSPEFAGLGKIKMYFHGNLYKYTVGDEKNIVDANKLLIKIQEKGFKDAFLVAFLNEERISPTQAVKLLNQK